MPKLETGDYIVTLYDAYGTPIKKKNKPIFNTYTSAQQFIQEKIEKNKAASGTIDRRLYNSIDNNRY